MMWAAPAHSTATLGRLACLMVRVTTGLSGLATADEVQEGEVASYVVTRRVQAVKIEESSGQKIEESSGQKN